MALKDRADSFGWVSIAVHWTMAISIIGMFALGLYMDTLSYYDPDYRLYPHWHKSIGLLLVGLFGFRLLWRAVNTSPDALGDIKLEIVMAKLAHFGLYALLLVVFVSGYLISTADGRAIEVFNWFAVPASGIAISEDTAGAWHYYSTHVLIALAAVHALAALKHHFINKDRTLRRMLGLN